MHKSTNSQIHKSTKNPHARCFSPPIQKLSACVFGKSKKKKSWEEGTRRKIKPKKLKIATNGLEKKIEKKWRE